MCRGIQLRDVVMPTIDKIMFIDAFEHGVDGRLDYARLAYLDRNTGQVLWLYEQDEHALDEANIPMEVNREGWKRIVADRERYLAIGSLHHGDEHDILRRFLRSNWTDDDARRERAREAYSGSIGRWKRHVRDAEAVRAYFAFQEEQVISLAEEFLRENGIEPQWR